jgi:hypothetical protein
MPQKVFLITESQQAALPKLREKMGCKFDSEVFRRLLSLAIKREGIA